MEDEVETRRDETSRGERRREETRDKAISRDCEEYVQDSVVGSVCWGVDHCIDPSLLSVMYICTVSFILWRATGPCEFPHQHIPTCETARRPSGRVPSAAHQIPLLVER